MKGRICSKCKTFKSAENFRNHPAGKNGLHSRCRACESAYTQQWHRDNRERSNEYKRQTYTPEMGKAAYEKRKLDPEAFARDRAWQAQYQKTNREKLRPYKAAKRSERRATQLQATPAWADKNKIAEFYFAADLLSMVTGEWYHVDHIVPLQSNKVCGLHCQQNLQILPASDNISKNNRHWPDMPE